MRKLKFFKVSISKTWSSHLVNFIVVLLSVILAFWLNNKSVEKSQNNKKQHLLSILKESLENDKSSLNQLIAFNLNRVDSLSELRKKIAGNETISIEESLDLASYNFFGVDKSSFEIIKNSDIISAINNNNLVSEVGSVFYTYDEDIETLQEEYNLAFQRVIEPFLIENVNTITQEISLDYKKRVQFMNRIYVLEDNLKTIISGYEKARNKIDKALKEITIELNQ